jgi:hypothetical protein
MVQAEKRTLNFEFLPNPAQESEGMGHAGIQTYRNDPYAGTARETGQNSRDAGLHTPVRISYEVLEIAREDVPGIDNLVGTLEQCLAQSHDTEKEIPFLDLALAAVKSQTIKVLRISDSNTSGAKGPAPGTPFHSLVKASGVSVKENTASGGSFGIGKNAVFALSNLQTVFYSTVYSEAGENRFLAQGKAILLSHTDKDSVSRKQTGYWGLSGFLAIDQMEVAPEWLRRNEVGTSVFVLGFRDTPNWANRILCSVVQNFFPAIDAGEMEFSIDGARYQIGKHALSSLFENPEIIATAKDNHQEQDFELAHSLYRCLISQASEEETVELPELGRVRIRILVEEGLPKKVILARNGMVITDSLEHFGERFAKFPRCQDFVALVTPLDSAGSAYIKRLEDPRHQALSAEGLSDPSARARAKSIMRKLADAIRKAIKTHTQAAIDSQVSLDELRPYFSSPANGNSSDSSTDGVNDPETIQYTIVSPNRRTPTYATGRGEGEAGGGTGGDEPGPSAQPGATSSGTSTTHPSTGGGNARHPFRSVLVADVRNVIPIGESRRHRTIYFTPGESGVTNLSIQALGLANAETLNIRSASGATVVSGRARLEVVRDQRVRIEIELEEDYIGPIDVLMNVVEPEAAQ